MHGERRGKRASSVTMDCYAGERRSRWCSKRGKVTGETMNLGEKTTRVNFRPPKITIDCLRKKGRKQRNSKIDNWEHNHGITCSNL